MVEVKAAKTRDGLLLSGQLPQELLSSTSLGIIPLRDGSFLLTPRQEQPRVSSLLTEKEKGVVRKLLAVRFEKRLPSQVGAALSKDEKETLESLMKKNIVHIFHSERYPKEGVYSISDFAFHQAREPAAQAQPAGAQAQPQPAAPIPISSPEHAEKFGWMVLESEQEAKNFSNAFPEKVRSGSVRGIRAFDRKYYFVTPKFVELWEKKIFSSLSRGEKSAEELAHELGLLPEGCRCLLYHLCESGDILEKSRGNFAKA